MTMILFPAGTEIEFGWDTLVHAPVSDFRSDVLENGAGGGQGDATIYYWTPSDIELECEPHRHFYEVNPHGVQGFIKYWKLSENLRPSQ